MKIIDAPTLDISEFLMGDDEAKKTQLKNAGDLYLKNGMLVLRNAFNPALIETLRDEFFIKYQIMKYTLKTKITQTHLKPATNDS